MTQTELQTPGRKYDVVVIGGGPVGLTAATRAAARGATTALVEVELIGGECGHWACMPSKALLRSGHALRAARRLPGSREAVTGGLDAAAVFAHRDEVVGHHDDGGRAVGLEGAGVAFLRGRARLDGPRRVVVDTADHRVVELSAAKGVVLATGSTAAMPEVPGLREARPWTNREGTGAKDAPRRLVVLGAGPSGLELAQAMSTLGSEQVVVLHRGSRLLPNLEPFVGELVLAGLREDGVEVRFEVDVVRVQRDHPDGEVVVHLADGSSVVGDELLVAAGRRPLTGDLGLDTIGLVPGYSVPVDETLQAQGSDWLYAVGDVNGRALLTHQGKYQARVAVDALLARSAGEQPPYVARADQAAVPQVIFTDPEVAAVGLSSAQAVDRGIRTRTVEAELGATAGGSLHAQGYTGRAALVIDEDADVIVGATFVGQDVADMVHAATIAIVGKVPLETLRHAVPSFPTLSEAWLHLLDDHGAWYI